MEVSRAQATAVHALPQLLTAQQCDELLAADWSRAASIDFGAGLSKRGGSWRTLYLHTGGGFARGCPEIRALLLEAAFKADAAEGWGLMSRDTSNFRTEELHFVGVGGTVRAAAAAAAAAGPAAASAPTAAAAATAAYAAAAAAADGRRRCRSWPRRSTTTAAAW